MLGSVTYCDYNATAPLRPQAREAMLHALDIGANPSSVHQGGRKARAMIEAARACLAEGLGVSPAQIVFTSGGTESVSTALWGARAMDPCLQLWASGIEHDCVLRQGVVRSISVDADGRISLLDLRENLNAIGDSGMRPFVSLMLVNNETGILQPITEVAAMVHDSGGIIHCDAVQAVGKMAIDFKALNVDYLSISAHKMGGPQGVGALLIRDGLSLYPRQSGGGQESGRRAGTENLAGIAGFGAAFKAASEDYAHMQKLAQWRDQLERALSEAVPDICVYGQQVERLPNTCCFGLSGLSAETQMMALDLEKISVSAGSACSSGRVSASHVLQAMGVSETEAGCAIRASFGWASTQADFTRLADVWTKFVAGARPEMMSERYTIMQGQNAPGQPKEMSAP